MVKLGREGVNLRVWEGQLHDSGKCCDHVTDEGFGDQHRLRARPCVPCPSRGHHIAEGFTQDLSLRSSSESRQIKALGWQVTTLSEQTDGGGLAGSSRHLTANSISAYFFVSLPQSLLLLLPPPIISVDFALLQNISLSLTCACRESDTGT